MAYLFSLDLRIDNDEIVARSILAIFSEPDDPISLTPTKVQMEMNVATFFQTDVWIINETVNCKPTDFKFFFFEKIFLLEVSEDSFFPPIVISVFKLSNSCCWNIGQ